MLAPSTTSPSNGRCCACIETRMKPPIDCPAPITAAGETTRPPVNLPSASFARICATAAQFAAATSGIRVCSGGSTVLSPTPR
jgi:hypothetical protein